MTEGAAAGGLNMRKEERNKWGFLPAPLKVGFVRQAWKEARLEGETVYAVVPCKHIPALA